MSPKIPHVGKPAARSLDRYREKRSASRTPEPFGRAVVSGMRFVVQKHAARLLHYDFRLEWNGVLLSWAVPKGPSLDPADKRFAVAVEDHPVDYVDFEGVIPEKNYGAGEVIVWDKGRWQPIEDPDEGLVAGKLSFVLYGYKLRGEFALVRTKQKSNPHGDALGKNWLLLKHQDAFVQVGAAQALDESSVLSGLTLEEIAAGVPRARAVVASIASRPKKLVDGAVQTPMLCEPSDPFSDPKYGFELKFDGYRLFGEKRDGVIALHYRRKMVATHLYPEIVLALSRLPYDAFLADGEVTVADASGMPSFPRLQERALLGARTDIDKASIERPATFHIFDLLSLDGRDLRDLPLVERKALLQAMLPTRGPLKFVEHIVAQGREMFEAVRQMGLEGVVGKKLDSKYTGTRSAHWKKVRISHEADVAIVGLQESETVGRAAGARSFHMAALDDQGVWRYVGRVGNGFVDAELQQLRAKVEGARRDKPLCQGTLPKGRGHLWSDPVAVAVVSWKTFSKDGILREPVFHRLREDKAPEDCRWEQLVATAPIARLEPAPPQAVAPEAKSVSLSNAKKIFWPEKKLTKGDLFAYYDAIAPFILPYLKDRPVMLTRFPDGIHGKSFFQKDAPSWTPSWVRTELMWNEDSGRQIHHFVIDDRETLLYVANLGAIPLHLWSSRIGTLEQPDWSILDLDPKGAPFTDVIEVARVAYSLCEEIGLPSFCKTSGSSGLHVMIPLGKLITHEQSRQLAHLLATEIARRIPTKATLARVIGDREGKVYIDYLQNGHGKLLAGPLAARPVVAATVSMPLRWSEVVPTLDPSAFELTSAPARLRSLGADPLLPVLTTVPDLMGSLERLAALAGGAAST